MRMSLQSYETKMRNWQRKMPLELERALGVAAAEVIGYTQKKRLSGPKMPRGESGGFFGSRLAVGQHYGGHLRDSLTKRVKVTGQKVTAKIGTNVGYGAVHEFGKSVKRGSKMIKMPLRPWLRPSVQEERPRILKQILAAMMRSYRGSGT